MTDNTNGTINTEINELNRSRASMDFTGSLRHKPQYNSLSNVSISTNPERMHHLQAKAANGTHFLPYVDYRTHLDRVQ
jgi:hypothetical protein